MFRRMCSASRTASEITVSRAGESLLSSCDASLGAARIDAAISNMCVFSIGPSLARGAVKWPVAKSQLERIPFKAGCVNTP